MTKAITFHFAAPDGTDYEKTFVTSSIQLAWIRAARYVAIHSAKAKVVGIRLVRWQRVVESSSVNVEASTVQEAE